MTIHSITGTSTYIEVDAETGQTEATFTFRTPREADTFSAFMGAIFRGVELIVESPDDEEEEDDD